MPAKSRGRVGRRVNPAAGLPELGVGLIYTSALAPLLDSHPDAVDVLEIEPQTTWVEQPDRPGSIRARSDVDARLATLPFPKLVHSIGTPVGGSVPSIEAQLPLLREAVRNLDAPWASEHLAFNLTPDYFTGLFLPPRQTPEGLEVYASAVHLLAEAVEVPVAVETGVNYLRPRPGDMGDGEFMAELSLRTNCGILLDLHNVYANELNGRQTVAEFLNRIPVDRVWEIHLAGGFQLDGFYLDAHSGAIPDELFRLCREIIPSLPNVKAILFELLSSYLPRFGIDGVRNELERMRELWQLRRPVAAAPTRRRSREVPRAGVDVAAVTEWESTLGALVIGRNPETPLARELASDPGIELMRTLVREVRASMVVSVYRLSCRLMMLALTPDVFRSILEDFWEASPPHQYAASEAEAFMAFLREKHLELPQLPKVLEFEKAAMDTMIDGQPRVVRFSFDPLPLLRALAEGRLPYGLPQPGDYEIQLNAEGPVTISGVDLDLRDTPAVN